MSSHSSSRSHAPPHDPHGRPVENVAQRPKKPAKSLSDILEDFKSSTEPSGVKGFEQLPEGSGTECEVQALYEDPRKCECCVNWVDIFPQDVKNLIKEEATAEKKALVIRLKRNHSESWPLSLHSIVVQNQQIKELLGQVFQGYKGITPDLKKLVLRAPFRPFFDRWGVFNTLVEEQKASNHPSYPFSMLLYRFFYLELQSTVEEIDDLIRIRP